MKKYISYCRVSTQRQGVSGLGLEAQEKTISEYVHREGGEVIAKYIEVESGTRKNVSKRVEIVKALEHCKQTGSILVVAKLDRLARDVQFIANILNSSAEVVFCDFPHAGRLVILIMSAIAEYESSLISARTRDALAIAKSRGVKLGNPKLNHSAAAKASSIARKSLQQHSPNIALKGRIERMRLVDKMPLSQIAHTLNNEGLRTTRNKQFNDIIIHRILKPVQ